MGLFKIFKIIIGVSDTILIGNRRLAKSLKAIKNKNYESALSLINKVIERKPNFYKSYYLRSHVNFLKGNYDEALSDSNLTLNLKNNCSWAYLIKGSCYLKKENYQEALKVFEQGLLYFPKNPFLIESAGTSYLCLDKLENANESYKKAYKLNKSIGFCNSILYQIVHNKFQENLKYIEAAKKLKYNAYGKMILNYLEAINSCMLGTDYSHNLDLISKHLKKIEYFNFEFTWIDEWLEKETLDENKRKFIVELNKEMKEIKKEYS